MHNEEPMFTFSKTKFHSEQYVQLENYIFTLYFVVMADTGAGSAKRKGDSDGANPG